MTTAGAPQLVELDAQVLGSGNAFGTWRSEKDARRALESLAREHQWCFKLLGLEDGAGILLRTAGGALQGRLRGQGTARRCTWRA